MKYYIGRFLFRYRSILYFLLFALMVIPLKWWAVFPWMKETHHWLTWVIGVILLFLAAFIRIYSAFYIGWKGKPDDPLKRVLTIDGPYRYTRNPLYWGNIIGFAGAAIIFKLLWFAPIAAGAIFILHHFLITWYEENRMHEKYGQAYEDYCKVVPRWGPKLIGLPPHDPTRTPFPWKRVFMAELGSIGGFFGPIIVAIIKDLYL